MKPIECQVCKEPEEVAESRVRGLKVYTCGVCNRELRPNGDPVPTNHAAEASKRRTIDIIEETYVDLCKEMN